MACGGGSVPLRGRRLAQTRLGHGELGGRSHRVAHQHFGPVGEHRGVAQPVVERLAIAQPVRERVEPVTQRLAVAQAVCERVEPGAVESPAPRFTASANGSGCAVSARGVPSSCTVVGAAVSGNDDPAVFEGQVGGSLGVRRTYFQSGQVSNAVRVAQADKAAGRVSWISFKLPYTWKEMAAGKGDAWARDLAKRLGAVGGHVWVAFHHEPETDRNQSIGDWVAMQKTVAGGAGGGVQRRVLGDLHGVEPVLRAYPVPDGQRVAR